MADLQSIFKKLYVPQDFVSVTTPKLTHEDEKAITASLTMPAPVKIAKKSSKKSNATSSKSTTSSPSLSSSQQPEAPASLYRGTTKYESRVMLLTGKNFCGRSQKEGTTAALPQSTNGKKDPKEEKESREGFHWLEKDIKFMVVASDKTITAPGGFWNSELDGPDPADDEGTLVRTAIRCFKAQTQVDLSPCQRWVRFAELRYAMKGDDVGTSACEVVSVIYVPVCCSFPAVVEVPGKNGSVALSWLSLNGLLDYDEEDIGGFEVSLFGELFKLRLCALFGRVVFEAIVAKVKEEEEDNSDSLGENPPAAKRLCKENEEEERKEDVAVAAAAATISVTTAATADKDALRAFQFFDRGATGFIRSKDLSALLLFLNNGLSRRMVQDYVARFESKESSGFVPYARIVERRNLSTCDGGDEK